MRCFASAEAIYQVLILLTITARISLVIYTPKFATPLPRPINAIFTEIRWR